VKRPRPWGSQGRHSHESALRWGRWVKHMRKAIERRKTGSRYCPGVQRMSPDSCKQFGENGNWIPAHRARCARLRLLSGQHTGRGASWLYAQVHIAWFVQQTSSDTLLLCKRSQSQSCQRRSSAAERSLSKRRSSQKNPTAAANFRNRCARNTDVRTRSLCLSGFHF
jgi:hypothetical protein